MIPDFTVRTPGGSNPLDLNRPAPIPRPFGLGKRPVAGQGDGGTWRDRGGGRRQASDGLVTTEVAEDGTVTSTGEPPPVSFEGGSVTFDVTDMAMRAAGQDPYQSRRAALLDRTRDERAAMSLGYRRRVLRDSVAGAKQELARIWRDPGRTAEQKRRIIFQLWDECAEDGSKRVLAASRAIRATIVSFVRRRLPKSSERGYRDAELRALNRRRSSRRRFAPYAE